MGLTTLPPSCADCLENWEPQPHGILKACTGLLLHFLFTFSTFIYIYIYIYICGRGSSVGIATDYELDGPGSNPGGDEIFRQPRPVLGPTQPTVKWVPGLPRG